VVSFGGACYKLKPFSRWRSTVCLHKFICILSANQIKPLSQVERAGETESLVPVYDADGNITGYEKEKKPENEDKEDKGAAAEDAEEEEMSIDIEGAPVGLTDSDIEAEQQCAKEEQERMQAEFTAKAKEMMEIPDAQERDAARKKLLEEYSYTTTTVTMKSWI
jgi:hypothetical protein